MPPKAINVEIKGLAQLAKGCSDLADDIARDAGLAFRELANIARDQTAVKVPHRSGVLAGSATVLWDEKRETASVGIGGGVPYAGWIEFGGGRYKGRKFVKRGRYLYPTARRTARELRPEGEKAAAKAIRNKQWLKPS